MPRDLLLCEEVLGGRLVGRGSRCPTSSSHSPQPHRPLQGCIGSIRVRLRREFPSAKASKPITCVISSRCLGTRLWFSVQRRSPGTVGYGLFRNGRARKEGPEGRSSCSEVATWPPKVGSPRPGWFPGSFLRTSGSGNPQSIPGVLWGSSGFPPVFSGAPQGRGPIPTSPDRPPREPPLCSTSTRSPPPL